LSTGEHVPNTRRLDRELGRLRRVQRTCARRRGPNRRTRTEPSNRWRKARARADRIHTQVANLRRNDTHQLTTRLAREFDTIVIEDLHVAGMLRNRRLARHIAGANWAEIRRQLAYKADRAGVRLVVADRWFASSKTCSQCGTAKTKLALSERTFVCMSCGFVLDRDINWWPTPASRAGSSPTEPVSDRTSLLARQSDRCGKSRSRLNAVTAR
jgi:putative transposase